MWHTGCTMLKIDQHNAAQTNTHTHTHIIHTHMIHTHAHVCAQSHSLHLCTRTHTHLRARVRLRCVGCEVGKARQHIQLCQQACQALPHLHKRARHVHDLRCRICRAMPVQRTRVSRGTCTRESRGGGLQLSICPSPPDPALAPCIDESLLASEPSKRTHS